MNNLVTILFAFFSFHFSYSQCRDSIQIPYQDGSFSKYIGCLDDEGRPSGQGIERNKKYTREGNWERGELNGFGKLTFSKSNTTYEGEWLDGKIAEGNFYQRDGEYERFYEGGFDEFNFYGKGVLKTLSPDANSIETGDFFNDQLYEGTSTEVYNNGLIVFKKISKGKVVNEKRNDKNYYNKDDIIGDLLYSEIPLKREGNQSSGISYKVQMKSMESLENGFLILEHNPSQLEKECFKD